MLGAIVETVLAERAGAGDVALLLDSELVVEGEDCSVSFLLVPGRRAASSSCSRAWACRRCRRRWSGWVSSPPRPSLATCSCRSAWARASAWRCVDRRLGVAGLAHVVLPAVRRPRGAELVQVRRSRRARADRARRRRSAAAGRCSRPCSSAARACSPVSSARARGRPAQRGRRARPARRRAHPRDRGRDRRQPRPHDPRLRRPTRA